MQCVVVDDEIGGLIMLSPHSICREFVFLLNLGIFSYYMMYEWRWLRVVVVHRVWMCGKIDDLILIL